MHKTFCCTYHSVAAITEHMACIIYVSVQCLYKLYTVKLNTLHPSCLWRELSSLIVKSDYPECIIDHGVFLYPGTCEHIKQNTDHGISLLVNRVSHIA